MKLSAKTNYACRALLELALHWPKAQPMQVPTIARKQHIPIKFLPHILIQLKQLGYVASIRGNKGGYVLIKSPTNFTLKDVIRDFDNSKLIPVNPKGKSTKADTLEAIWREASQVLIDSLNQWTFDEICKREQSLNKVEMFSI